MISVSWTLFVLHSSNDFETNVKATVSANECFQCGNMSHLLFLFWSICLFIYFLLGRWSWLMSSWPLQRLKNKWLRELRPWRTWKWATNSHTGSTTRRIKNFGCNLVWIFPRQLIFLIKGQLQWPILLDKVSFLTHIPIPAVGLEPNPRSVLKD